MSHLIDLKGRKMGHWLVGRRVQSNNGKTRWLCECHCNRRCNCGGMAADVPQYRANTGQAAVAAEANPLKEVYGTM